MIKVLIVDDSVVFRKILQEALGAHPHIRVVGTAQNGKEALRAIRTLRPHLLILDVEMPEMDGLETLDEIRRQRLNVGVIMFSTLTSKGAKTTLEALSKGAFDFTPKPTGQGAFAKSVKRIKEELIPKIEAFGLTRKEAVKKGPLATRFTRSRTRPATRPHTPTYTKSTHMPSVDKAGELTGRIPCSTRRIAQRPEAVAIGVSTGGPNALNHVIPKFPKNFRLPIFLVQHMPPVFTNQLAKRLDEKSPLKVVEATDRQIVQPGTVYVAPGDYHMEVHANNSERVIRLNQNPPVNSCRPAVDVLFHSLSQVYGGRVVAVIMTGMGQDGLEGAKELKKKGAFIIAQDKETCVVWGMPRFVQEAGIADRVCPLDSITDTVLEFSCFARQIGRNNVS